MKIRWIVIRTIVVFVMYFLFGPERSPQTLLCDNNVLVDKPPIISPMVIWLPNEYVTVRMDYPIVPALA